MGLQSMQDKAAHPRWGEWGCSVWTAEAVQHGFFESIAGERFRNALMTTVKGIGTFCKEILSVV